MASLAALAGKKGGKKKVRIAGPKALDEKYTGGEPVFIGWEDWDPETFVRERSRINYYYNYHSTAKKLLPQFFKWMDEFGGYSKAEIKKFKTMNLRLVSVLHGGYASARLNGMPDTHDGLEEYLSTLPGISNTKTYFKSVDSVLKKAVESVISSQVEEEEDSKATKKKLSPMEKMHIKLNSTILSDLDALEDDVLRKGLDISYDISMELVNNSVAPAGCDHIAEYLNARIAEMSENDKFARESYESWPEGARDAALKFWKESLNAVQSYALVTKTAKVTTRKPRVKKAVPLAKQVAKLKYKSVDTTYNLSSVAPSDIPGSTMVFLFNTKGRRLTVLQSDTTFVVSGSTIKNVDVDNSFSMTIRKPEVLQKLILNRKSASVVLKNLEKEIKTARGVANGRCNDQTILLRTIK